jgi:hypothetical protein
LGQLLTSAIKGNFTYLHNRSTGNQSFDMTGNRITSLIGP